MCKRLIDSVKNRIRKIKNDLFLDQITITESGICLAIYCFKIYQGVLKDDERIYAYEEKIKKLYKLANPDSPHYDYDERNETAYNYVAMAVRCSNKEKVMDRICDAMKEYENK